MEMPSGIWTRVGPRNHVLDAHWRNLANSTEPFMWRGDAAFMSNYFDHNLGLLFYRELGYVYRRSGKNAI